MKIILFALLLIFNALDVYQTWLLMEVGLGEWNPIVDYMIRHFGFFQGVVSFKLFWLSLLGILIIVKDKKRIQKEGIDCVERRF